MTDASTALTEGSAAPDADATSAVALEIRGLSKTFPGVRALQDVDLAVAPGSVHALIGHNGCGKSTLIKCLAGVYEPDPGARSWIEGQEFSLGDASSAERSGLRFVHQDLGIVPELGAVDNLGFVNGYQRNALGGISWRRQAQRTTELLRQFGFSFDPMRPLAEASPPQRVAVAIIRAVAGWQAGRGVLVLDEPTAALPAHEVDHLFEVIREVSATGSAVILVSHRLDEVMAIADHVTVLRDGRRVWDGPLASSNLGHLVTLIGGTDEDAGGASTPSTRPGSSQPSHRATGSQPVSVPALRLTSLQGRYLRGVDLAVESGEVVGVAGLLGSGREELPYIVAGGQTNGLAGTVEVNGSRAETLSSEQISALGVSFVPADRAGEAIVPGFSTTENVSLGGLPSLRKRGLVGSRAERRFARKWFTSVDGDAKYTDRPILTLSGGNQQKAVLARALSVAPRLLVLSEPTAGVDIGARQVIYEQLRVRARDGLAVLVASSDLEDLIACCDRVVVLRDGLVAGTFEGPELTKAAITYAMEGAHDVAI